MLLVKIDADLERETPVEYWRTNVKEETEKHLCFGPEGKKRIDRDSLFRVLLDRKNPAKGCFYLTLEGDAARRRNVKEHPSVKLGTFLLLDKMEDRMHACAVKLRQAQEEDDGPKA